jgi:hypothetical protein
MMAIQEPAELMSAMPNAGILDLDHPENPFHDYSMVAVPYCTADLHLGERDAEYRIDAGPGSGGAPADEAGGIRGDPTVGGDGAGGGAAGSPGDGDAAGSPGDGGETLTIRHRGRVNGMAVLAWMEEAFHAPRTVFVSGGSAGGMATPYYARLLALRHTDARIVGLADDIGSYRAREGTVPDHAVWGIPEVLGPDPTWDGLWDAGFDMRDLFVRAARDVPNLRLAQFDHARDDGQRGWLETMGTPNPDILALVRANRRAIRNELPGFRGYLGAGVHHTILDHPLFYRHHVGGVRLRDWVADLAAGRPVADVDCGDCLRPGFSYTEADLAMVERAIELLAPPGGWNREARPPCLPGAESFSLICALVEGIREVEGLPEPSHVLYFNAVLGHPAAWEVLYAILDRESWSGPALAPLFTWDRAPDVARDDVLEVLEGVRARIRRGLEEGLGASVDGPGSPSPAPLPSFAELEEGWNALAPGGRTSCAHGDPFSFFVRPGDPARLLLYLTGGGACWDAEGCPDGSLLYTQRVTPEADPGRYSGIIDPGHPENPFAEHTMVVVPVCTGDLHLGDRDALYVARGDDGEPREFTVRHRGLVNVTAALDWMHENTPEPAEAFVAGSSAGAPAVPFYANLLARRHPAARVAGLSDDGGSYLTGTAPAVDTRTWGVPGVLQSHPGWEGLPPGIGIETLFVTAGRAVPNLRLYQVDHANDRVQHFFLRQGGHPNPEIRELVRAARDRIGAEVPAFRGFTLGGYLHTMLRNPSFYLLQEDGYRFRDWVAAIAAGDEVPHVGCSSCAIPGLVYDEEDLRAYERALELLARDDAWAPHTSGSCPSEEGRYTLQCAVIEGYRSTTDSPLAGRGGYWDLAYSTGARVAYVREGWSPMARFNDDADTSIADVRALLEEIRDRIRASVR